MAALPVEVAFGIYLGLLTGIVPALVAGALGFVFKYFSGVTLPGFGVVVLAVAIAGVNGGLLGLVDPSIANSPRLLVAVLVVMMLSLYAHSQGDKLGATTPRRFSLRAIRKRTISADLVDFVGGIGEVTITPSGPISDMEGYPPLSAELRSSLAAGTWRLPADLPLEEMETRLGERLRTEFDLADVAVEIDARGGATIAAAPPASGLSRRVPAGKRAVSVAALVPTGLARGDEVTVITADRRATGTLLSARSDPKKESPAPAAAPLSGDDGLSDGDPIPDGGLRDPVPDGGTDDPVPQVVSPTTDGGEGRVTVAVDRSDAVALLKADRGRVVVGSRGTRREYELLSLFRRAGKRVSRVTVRRDGPLDGVTLGEAAVRDAYGVAALAIRRPAGDGDGERSRGWTRRFRNHRGESTHDHDWRFSPRGDTAVAAGDELFVVGAREDLTAFAEAVA